MRPSLVIISRRAFLYDAPKSFSLSFPFLDRLLHFHMTELAYTSFLTMMFLICEGCVIGNAFSSCHHFS